MDMMMNPLNGSIPLDGDALVSSHPKAELIRRIQRTGYRAYSRRHKQGLDALSFCLGPFAPIGFGTIDDHRQQQDQECCAAVQELLAGMGQSIADRRVITLLLADYPGRSPVIASSLKRHLGYSV